MTVESPVVAQMGGQPLSCAARSANVGTTKSTVQFGDFRLFISKVRMIGADGAEVPLVLDQDGIWQLDGTVLLDFEDSLGTIACASCHDQAMGSADGRVTATGIGSAAGHRNAPELVNAGYLPVLTRGNPLVDTQERHALIAMFGIAPVEMGGAGQERAIVDRLAADPVCVAGFAAAFPDGPAPDLYTITRALAAFQRMLVSASSTYDRSRSGGDPEALTLAARRGEDLFFGERSGMPPRLRRLQLHRRSGDLAQPDRRTRLPRHRAARSGASGRRRQRHLHPARRGCRPFSHRVVAQHRRHRAVHARRFGRRCPTRSTPMPMAGAFPTRRGKTRWRGIHAERGQEGRPHRLSAKPDR